MKKASPALMIGLLGKKKPEEDDDDLDETGEDSSDLDDIRVLFPEADDEDLELKLEAFQSICKRSYEE